LVALNGKDNARGEQGRGLLLVFTGNGKGKTTSALGLALRFLGHGDKVAMVQFIKGKWKTGEREAAKLFGDRFDFHVMGRGFTWKSDDTAKDVALAREGWELAKKIIAKGEHALVILDELTYLIKYDMVDEQDVVAVLRERPRSVHVAVTGRDAGELLRDEADLVTEMREIKHHFSKGIKAGKGIEF